MGMLTGLRFKAGIFERFELKEANGNNIEE
jgi:hypothetical protein